MYDGFGPSISKKILKMLDLPVEANCTFWILEAFKEFLPISRILVENLLYFPLLPAGNENVEKLATIYIIYFSNIGNTAVKKKENASNVDPITAQRRRQFASRRESTIGAMVMAEKWEDNEIRRRFRNYEI